MKRIRYDRLFILAVGVGIIVYLILWLILVLTIDLIIKDTEKTNLKAHSEVLTVEGYNYTTQAQTNVLGVSNEEYNGVLCGLETVTCKSEEGTTYRMTSYYTGDSTGSGSWVGAGINTSEFEVNENGWYTYEGKIVIAGATNECLNSTKDKKCMEFEKKEDKHYFNYFDELVIEIDGIKYDAIVLDSCGGSMELDENRIDLFVSGEEHFIDRGYKGINPVEVFY